MKSTPNREEWLTEVAKLIVPIFQVPEFPKFRVTCGWPVSNGLANKKRTIGQCFGAESSGDGSFEIFISPLLDKPMDVAGTVAHELVHVVAGIEAGHKSKFVRFAKRIGLTNGKPTQASPGKQLEDTINGLLVKHKIPEYPHKAISPKGKVVDSSKAKDVTLTCTECQCKIRITFAWITKSGIPTCGCGGTMDTAQTEE